MACAATAEETCHLEVTLGQGESYRSDNRTVPAKLLVQVQVNPCHQISPRQGLHTVHADIVDPTPSPRLDPSLFLPSSALLHPSSHSPQHGPYVLSMWCYTKSRLSQASLLAPQTPTLFYKPMHYSKVITQPSWISTRVPLYHSGPPDQWIEPSSARLIPR